MWLRTCLALHFIDGNIEVAQAIEKVPKMEVMLARNDDVSSLPLDKKISEKSISRNFRLFLL